MGLGTAQALVMVATLVVPLPQPAESSGNWCQVGQMVMIPDGREGPVTSVDGEICRVLAYGEKYVSLWPYEQIEPVDPPAQAQNWHSGF